MLNRSVQEHVNKWKESGRKPGPGRIFVTNAGDPRLSNELEAAQQKEARDIAKILEINDQAQRNQALREKCREIAQSIGADAWKQDEFLKTDDNTPDVNLFLSYMSAITTHVVDQREKIIAAKTNDLTQIGMALQATMIQITKTAESVYQEMQGIQPVKKEANEAIAQDDLLAAERLNETLRKAINQMPLIYGKTHGLLSKGKNWKQVNDLVQVTADIKSGPGTEDVKFNKLMNQLVEAFQAQYNKHNDNFRKTSFVSSLFKKPKKYLFDELNTKPNDHHYTRMLALTLQAAKKDSLYDVYKFKLSPDKRQMLTEMEKEFNSVTLPAKDKNHLYEVFRAQNSSPALKG